MIKEMPPPTPSKFMGLVEQMKREVVSQVEYEALRAQIVRARYTALIKEGFTPAEALEMCKASYQ